jgi:hypothetical protein
MLKVFIMKKNYKMIMKTWNKAKLTKKSSIFGI